MSVISGSQTLASTYTQLEIWAHYTQVRFNCVDYYHYLVIHSVADQYPVQDWMIRATTNWVYGWWTLQIPWGSISSVGTFRSNICTTYNGVSAGGAGTLSVTHYETGWSTSCFPYQTWDTAYLQGFQTGIWHSNQYGQSYLITFTLRYQDPTHGIDLSSFATKSITS